MLTTFTDTKPKHGSSGIVRVSLLEIRDLVVILQNLTIETTCRPVAPEKLRCLDSEPRLCSKHPQQQRTTPSIKEKAFIVPQLTRKRHLRDHRSIQDTQDVIISCAIGFGLG